MYSTVNNGQRFRIFQSGFRPGDSTSYLLLPMKSINRLMRGLKLEGFS